MYRYKKTKMMKARYYGGWHCEPVKCEESGFTAYKWYMVNKHGRLKHKLNRSYTNGCEKFGYFWRRKYL